MDKENQIATPLKPPDKTNQAVAEASVVLRGLEVALDTNVGSAFVTDCCRNIEGLLSDAGIKDKWGLSDEDWANLANNKPLLEAIRAERERRILDNVAAREAAQKHLVKAPSVLNEILTDESVAPRHRIEAAKELRQAAGDQADLPQATEKVVINIDLGGDDKFRFEHDVPINRPLQNDDGEEP